MGTMLHKVLRLIYDFRSRGDSVPIDGAKPFAELRARHGGYDGRRARKI